MRGGEPEPTVSTGAAPVVLTFLCNMYWSALEKRNYVNVEDSGPDGSVEKKLPGREPGLSSSSLRRCFVTEDTKRLVYPLMSNERSKSRAHNIPCPGKPWWT